MRIVGFLGDTKLLVLSNTLAVSKDVGEAFFHVERLRAGVRTGGAGALWSSCKVGLTDQVWSRRIGMERPKSLILSFGTAKPEQKLQLQFQPYIDTSRF